MKEYLLRQNYSNTHIILADRGKLNRVVESLLALEKYDCIIMRKLCMQRIQIEVTLKPGQSMLDFM